MEVEALSQQINSAYNDMNKHPFELFGVWIHSGNFLFKLLNVPKIFKNFVEDFVVFICLFVF